MNIKLTKRFPNSIHSFIYSYFWEFVLCISNGTVFKLQTRDDDINKKPQKNRQSHLKASFVPFSAFKEKRVREQKLKMVFYMQIIRVSTKTFY